MVDLCLLLMLFLDAPVLFIGCINICKTINYRGVVTLLLLVFGYYSQSLEWTVVLTSLLAFLDYIQWLKRIMLSEMMVCIVGTSLLAVAGAGIFCAFLFVAFIIFYAGLACGTVCMAATIPWILLRELWSTRCGSRCGRGRKWSWSFSYREIAVCSLMVLPVCYGLPDGMDIASAASFATGAASSVVEATSSIAASACAATASVVTGPTATNTAASVFGAATLASHLMSSSSDDDDESVA